MEPASPSPAPVYSDGPFSGLVICVSGFSKEARAHIMEATTRLGGEYSTSLHSGCTHLVVKGVGGHKIEHAFKYRIRTGLFIVTFQWFIDSVMGNLRLRESLYSVQTANKTSNKIADSCNTVLLKCAPVPAEMIEERHHSSDVACKESEDSCLFGRKMYIDSDVSAELQGKPIWILKTARERCMQRFTRFSADLAREVRMLLENIPDRSAGKEKLTKRCLTDVSASNACKEDAEERQQIVNSAKNSIRNRRNHGMQVSLHAITPRTLLDSICWSISEPPSTASIYSDASVSEDVDAQASVFPNAKDGEKTLDVTFLNSSRPLIESEKNELILRHHFITVLFPVDRFSEMGPSSRTFYSDKGFTCLQVLNLIYDFYQEDMSDHEIEAAIHTDSRHADQLRAVYSDEGAGELAYKRIDFLGSRRSFEMLKRISGDNTGNVYELVIRA